MASTGVAPQLELRTNGKVKLDLFKWLPFIISLMVFIGGYYALRQEVSDLKEIILIDQQQTRQEIKDLREEVLDLYRNGKH